MRTFKSIGLMSGTSMDGIDVALLETDGETRVRPGAHAAVRYPSDLRQALMQLAAAPTSAPDLERQVTALQADAVQALCARENIDPAAIDVIGFHGQTIKHEPERARTWQLGAGQLMADLLKTRVVNNFRQNDMDHGGQGAPLVPAYHRALVRAQGIAEPIAVLNIGGVSNLTLIDGQELYACDCGPGNALIDDWVSAHCQVPYDDRGSIAASGQVSQAALAKLLSAPYFAQVGPKSLDRNAFSPAPLQGLSPQDGAATLAAFTAAAIALEAQRLSARPNAWIVVGGGRLNDFLVDQLRRRLASPVAVAEDFGWSGEAIEAQAFAYLAVRSVLALPLSWPSTTGVREPVSGGTHWSPT
jgi:anhydro-N-acetylmuramic acid kinase